MLKTFVLIVLVAAACLGASSQVVNEINHNNVQKNAIIKKDVRVDTATTYFNYVDSAQSYIKQKNWNLAESFIYKAIASDPKNNANSLLLSNLATVQRYEGKNADALRNYTQALELTPNAVTLLCNRAALYAQLDSIELAKADYERVRKLDKKNEESRYNLAIMAIGDKDFTQAEALFNEILQNDSESILANEGLGMLYKLEGNFEKAVDYLSAAINKGETAKLLANRADCYLMLRQLSNASVDIASAIKLTPNDGYLYLLRAKLNKMRFDFDSEKDDVELAVKNGVDKVLAQKLLQ